jgi:peroxiredoxin
MVCRRRSHQVVNVRLVRRPLCRLVLIVVGVVATCLPGASEEPNAELEALGGKVQESTVPKVDMEYAELLLHRTANAYEQFRTYQDETTVTLREAGPFGRTAEIRYSFAFEHPNKVAIERLPGISIVCDGEKLYTYVSAINKYTVEKAPETVEGILEATPFGLGWQGLAPLKILSLFGDTPYKTMTENVDDVEFVGDEKTDGTETHHLLLHGADATIDLWTDAETNLIKKIKIESSHTAGVPGAEPIQLILEEFHNQTQADAEILETTFVFEPPDGAEQTDDIIAELSGMAQTSPLIGKAAADFTLDGLGTTDSLRLSNYKGKVVLLSFWMTECPACDVEMPVLQVIYDEYKKRDAVVITINTLEDRRTVEEYIAKRKYTFPVALDTDGKVMALYKVEGFPTVILIGKDGTIRKVYPGYAQGFDKILRKELNKLLAE